ncbi:MAG: DUF2058 domain-containing protein [Geopsychrobacter sp.]|nr:DUF2058 domain-containing protein [Geopsychrobacter sp.]
MGLSLQEQLLKAGLVDKKQMKKADHEKRVKHKKKRKAGGSFEDRDKLRLRQQQAERAQHDLALNTERNQQAQRKADQAAVQQLITANHLAVEEGDVAYHYVDTAGKIKRILIQQDVADKLSNGRLGLAISAGELVLISAETVNKILHRDRDALVAYNDPTQEEDEYPTDW